MKELSIQEIENINGGGFWHNVETGFETELGGALGAGVVKAAWSGAKWVGGQIINGIEDGDVAIE